MSGMLKLEIADSAETLKQLMHQNCHPQQKAKLQALWWLQSGQANSVNQLAQLSGRHRTTISNWLSRYRTGGLNALLEVTPVLVLLQQLGLRCVSSCNES
jgi:hypothetical protein